MITNTKTIKAPDFDTLLALDSESINTGKVLALINTKLTDGAAEGAPHSACPAASDEKLTASKPTYSKTIRRWRVAALAAAIIVVSTLGTVGIAGAITGTDPITLIGNVFGIVQEENIYVEELAIGDPADQNAHWIEGLRFSDTQVVYRGATLPENVSPDQIYYPSGPSPEWIDRTSGTALGSYEYLFVDFTVTNETSSVRNYGFNSAILVVLGPNREILGERSEVCYYNGIDMAANELIMLNGAENGGEPFEPGTKKEGTPNYSEEQLAAKSAGLIELAPGETRTFSVAFFISRDTLALGELYFSPSDSMGMPVDDPTIPWYFTKLDI